MSFHLICEGLLAKNQKFFEVGKLRKYDGETESFEKKLSFLKKAFSPKWEGAKTASGTRVELFWENAAIFPV